MRDPYKVLGLGRNVSSSDIKKTYRQLAKKYHPDTNKSDSGNEKHFAEVSAAYDFLKDADRRARYDRGEINADGTTVGFGAGAGNS
ncbi:MAG: J domain-containing protein, partial [Halocynthiibacter sp.]